MLRTTKPIASEAADETQNAEPPAPSGIERRRHPRVELSPTISESEEERPSPQWVDRRKYDRRANDAMRDEIKWNTAAEVEDRGLPALFKQFAKRYDLKPKRVALILVALLAGGTAAFLASQNELSENTVKAQITVPIAKPEVVQEARMKILVAKETIGIGQRLSPTSLVWENWPEGSMRNDYITQEASPEAIADMSKTVARFEFFAGEPIREQKLAREADGYLSAVLGDGMRGVSISVTPESASGGFINPNDHVDVVLTRANATNQISETILHNVRVLAINSRLGEVGASGEPANPGGPRAEIFAGGVIVTLELDPTKAEVVISATDAGKLSLVLRSMVDFSETAKIAQGGRNQAIRMTSPFWTQTASFNRPQ